MGSVGGVVLFVTADRGVEGKRILLEERGWFSFADRCCTTIPTALKALSFVSCSL